MDQIQNRRIAAVKAADGLSMPARVASDAFYGALYSA